MRGRGKNTLTTSRAILRDELPDKILTILADKRAKYLEDIAYGKTHSAENLPFDQEIANYLESQNIAPSKINNYLPLIIKQVWFEYFDQPSKNLKDFDDKDLNYLTQATRCADFLLHNTQIKNPVSKDWSLNLLYALTDEKAFEANIFETPRGKALFSKVMSEVGIEKALDLFNDKLESKNLEHKARVVAALSYVVVDDNLRPYLNRKDFMNSLDTLQTRTLNIADRTNQLALAFPVYQAKIDDYLQKEKLCIGLSQMDGKRHLPDVGEIMRRYPKFKSQITDQERKKIYQLMLRCYSEGNYGFDNQASRRGITPTIWAFEMFEETNQITREQKEELANAVYKLGRRWWKRLSVFEVENKDKLMTLLKPYLKD